MAIKVGMVNLGCSKNQIDGEIMMGALKSAGFALCDDAGVADIAIVNTCGFIESAKTEAIEEILELCTLKKEGQIKKVVVTGCLAERYKDQIMDEIPEVDGVLGIGANGEIAQKLLEIWQGEKPCAFPEKNRLPLCGTRELTTPSFFAYIKIAEGCDNRCTYCAIPAIRGGYRSRTMESIVEEARALVENGAKELILIAQDTTRYGLDLYGKLMLPQLLHELCKIEKLCWLRVLYCYPDVFNDEMIDAIANEEKIVKYIDLPLQHASGKVLKAMNRRGDAESLSAFIAKLRARIPGLTLRTTVIAGFPGETLQDFEILSQFVKDMRFEKLGCFAYSQEEGTPAALLPDQIDEDEKQRRAMLIMDTQLTIMEQNAEKLVSTVQQVLIEGYDRYAECWFGRSAADAPDIDGKVFIEKPEKRPQIGQMVRVHIDSAAEGDLFGTLV